MLDGAIVVPVMQMIYSLLYEVGALAWSLQRALLLTGFVIMSITEWLVNQAFTPLLSALGAQTEVFLGPLFTIALLVLAGTYLMGVFLRIRVVEFKSAVVWFLVALLLFQGGPQLYQSVEELRRGISGAFYQEGITLLADGGGALAVLDDVGSGSEADIPQPTNQFGNFLPGDQNIDGLDVAMSYLGADAFDVLAPDDPLHPIERLPWSYIIPDGYFDFGKSGGFFGDMSREEREESIGRTVQGISRLMMGGFISIFGVLEQVIHLALAIAMGLAFASAFIAILFAFFKHTEVLMWSVLNLTIELFVQSVLMSLFLSLIISFVLVGAVTGNAVVTLGTVLVGLVLVFILLLAAFRAIWNGINRLFGAMGQVTGGTISSPGGVAAGAVGMATGAALGAVGGAIAYGTGSNLTQSAGIALGNNSTLTRAAYMTSLLPGTRDTRMGQLASQFTEGAIARTALGPVIGGAVISPRRTQAQRATEVDPITAVGEHYHPTPKSDPQTRLNRAFGSSAPRMAHLMDAHSEDEMLEIVSAVKATRQANPTLPASSPAFQSHALSRLSSDVANRFSPEDLQLVIRAVAGTSAERERFNPPDETASKAQAVSDYYRAPDRDSAYAGLQTAFGTTATPELAKVLDSHTEDDMTEVADAIRSLKSTHPDLAPQSDDFLRLLKTQLAGATSIPLSSPTLRTLTAGFADSPPPAPPTIINTSALANAIQSAVAGFQQIGNAQPLSFEQAASTVARSAGLDDPSQSRPFGSHTASIGNFVNQAVQMQATPAQTARIVNDVRQQGKLPDDLRSALKSHPTHAGRTPDEMNKSLRSLEAAARALPHAIVIGNIAPIPATTPPINIHVDATSTAAVLHSTGDLEG
ncbi:MAG: hypothetical protein RLP44_01615 [Aggregatilineales bacterium]